MATTKSMKIQAEIDKVKAKISEQQARLKELEQKKAGGGKQRDREYETLSYVGGGALLRRSFYAALRFQPTPIRTVGMRNRLLWKKLRPRSRHLPLPRARAFRRMETL